MCSINSTQQLNSTKFLAPPYYSQRTVFASPALFSLTVGMHFGGYKYTVCKQKLWLHVPYNKSPYHPVLQLKSQSHIGIQINNICKHVCHSRSVTVQSRIRATAKDLLVWITIAALVRLNWRLSNVSTYLVELKGSVKEPNKFHIYETEKITRKASDVAEYMELFGSFTRDRHARCI